PSGCTRASATGRRSSSRRSTRQGTGVDFAAGSPSGGHSTPHAESIQRVAASVGIRLVAAPLSTLPTLPA
ncbi:MAG: hypothetical protein M3Q71_12455, partial [Chloroflexota bacterium]|nr:hypothetical protein [Chloroflexota bacterium]